MESGPFGALEGALIGAAIGATVSFFEDLFGGGSAPPTPRQLLHAQHPLYPVILGVSDGVIPTEGSEGKPELCGDAQFCGVLPLQKGTPVATKNPDSAEKPRVLGFIAIESPACVNAGEKVHHLYYIAGVWSGWDLAEPLRFCLQ